MRADRRQTIKFTPAQGPLGQALYRHFGLSMDESYLLIDGGKAYTASAGYLHLAKVLGGPWHLLRVFALLPAPVRDRVYALIARNRYRWFGKAGFCELLSESQQARPI